MKEVKQKIVDAGEIAKVLRALADTIDEGGFPSQPMFLQGDPQANLGFFIALWHNEGQRQTSMVGD